MKDGKAKTMELLKCVAFAVSACLFLCCGVGMIFFDDVSRIELIVSFLVFFFLAFTYKLPKMRFQAKQWIGLIALCGLIALTNGLLYRNQLYYNGILLPLYQAFHLDQRVLGIRLGDYVLLGSISLFSLYALLAMFAPSFREAEPISGRRCILFSAACTKQSINALGLFFLSALYVFIHSICDPLRTTYAGGDHSLFRFIGELWGKGLVPYADIFDHKGPFTFLFYTVGLAISESHGIYLLQTLSLWLSLWFAYQMMNEKGEGRSYRFIGILGILIFLLNNEYGYMLTEEMCLPFLMASAYLANRYFTACSDQKAHPPFWAMVHGISFSVAFCTRVTNAAAVAAWVAVIVVLLIANKVYLNLALNALAFVLGFCIVFVPFAIYFALNNAFYDMMFGTLLYNIQYSLTSLGKLSAFMLMCRFLFAWPVWILLILSTFSSVRKNKVQAAANGLAALFSVYVTLSGYAYPHYSIILAVFIPINITYLFSELKHRKAAMKLNLIATLLGCFLIVICCNCAIEKTQYYENDTPSLFEIHSKQAASYIPREERDAVIGYNVSTLFYRYTNLIPCYKYYTNQDWWLQHSEQLISETTTFFESGHAKWVIVYDDIMIDEVRDTLNKNYRLFRNVSYLNAGIEHTLALYNRTK